MAEGIEKTRVEIEVTGDQAAQRKVEALNRDLKNTEQQAGRTTQAAQQAARESNMQSLRDRGILTRGGIKAGPIQLGPGGFGLDRGFFRGAGMGPAAGVVIAGHTTGAALNQVADWIEYIKQNDLSVPDMILSGARGISRSVFELTGAKSITRGIFRLAGEKGEVFDEAFESLFKTGKSQADLDIEAIGENQKKRWALMAAHEAAERRARAAIEAKVAEMYEQSDREYEAAMGNLKTRRNPLLLPEDTWREQRRLDQLAAENARLRKRQAVREQADALLPQEGG